MSKFKRIDLSRIKTIKFDDRETKSDQAAFGKVFDPNGSFADFLKSLPKYLKSGDLIDFSELIARAAKEKKTILWMMGAHPLKVGLSPVLIDLIRQGFVSHLAVNGAFIIHDVELAAFGRTSEEVADGLRDGSFGMVKETPSMIFEAAARAKQDGLGLAEGIGKHIIENNLEFKAVSVIGACYENSVPVTAHIAVGTDTIAQHPGYDGALFGELSYDDFLILGHSISRLSGGAVINIGSAVILPEVFLKALTAARNIHGKIEDFAAANFDMIQHYRPNVNVVNRPVAGSGRGFSFTGHHELLLPLLAAAIKRKYEELSRE